MKKSKQGKHFIFSRHVEDGEKILAVVHRHILVFKISVLKITAFGFFLPAFLYWLFPNALFIFVVWWFVALLMMAYKFIDWYYDVWLLTSNGVVDLERNGLFDMTSTRIEYHMMEGISYQIKGFIRTVFNYGDITIDKIGAQTSVVLKDAVSPRRTERMVMQFQEKYISNKSVKDHAHLKNMLADMIAYHMNNQ